VAIEAALVILTLLAIISFSASRVANNEVTMARNESVHQRNLYLAEGAAMEAVDRLTHTANLKVLQRRIHRLHAQQRPLRARRELHIELLHETGLKLGVAYWMEIHY
jgi:Tfp pilus assembly protein PilX